MSIEQDIVAAARSVLSALIDATRGTPLASEPALLIRVGQLDTRIAAAEALANEGRPGDAALAASDALRSIARDFPATPLPPLDLLAEESAYQEIARAELTL